MMKELISMLKDITGFDEISLQPNAGAHGDFAGLMLIRKFNEKNLEDNRNLAARSASGSARFDAYIICPASGTTIGKIASGISDNLATRSALVAMKERRKLIIIPLC